MTACPLIVMTARPLSTREQEVVALLIDGFKARQIAVALGISRRTVEHHIARVADEIPGSAPPIRRIVSFYSELSRRVR